jgi:hypothetical protein
MWLIATSCVQKINKRALKSFQWMKAVLKLFTHLHNTATEQHP